MNRVCLTIALLAVLLLGACSNETNLPVATGKGIIRAINAMPASPDFRFLIEERSIDSVGYRESSTAASYDDLEYTFNVEMFFAGESSTRRVASQFIDVEADVEYTLLVSGDVTAPAITVWENPTRSFDEGSTVFEARFAHTAASAPGVDVYFAAPGVAPALGDQVATLLFGEIAPPADFSEGDYVMTITGAGDPGTVLFVSNTTSFAAGDALILTPFDGVATDNAPVVVRSFPSGGNAIAIPDARFPPSVEFVNAAPDLAVSDIYEDEALSSQIVADLAYGDVSAVLDIEAGENVFYFTPAGDTAAVTLEARLPAFGGIRYRVVAAGIAGAEASLAVIPDRRSLQTQVKLSTLSASNNFGTLAVYALAPGESLADASPVQGIARLDPTTAAALPAGSYELYVTEFGQDQVLAGPYAVDVSLGDVVDMIILDAVDPAIVDVLFLTGGPAP